MATALVVFRDVDLEADVRAFVTGLGVVLAAPLVAVTDASRREPAATGGDTSV